MSSDAQDRADRRMTDQGFVETARGVQSASQAFEDGRSAADAEDRARAWRAVLIGNLL